MNKPEARTIYTIGYSTHSLADFSEMLRSFDIKFLVDIRRFPGSRRYPQFDGENLKLSMNGMGIQYLHMVDLGGRRPVKKDSKNNRWNNTSFRGYADYMETGEFESAILELEQMASGQPTAYMCSEAAWWRCHRAMVSDYLKVKGWAVIHIMPSGKAQEHQYTAPARVQDGKVFYFDESLGL